MSTEYFKNEPDRVEKVAAENKKPVNKNEKLNEKLKVLRQRLGKSVEVQNAAEKKIKDIRSEIAKCEKYIHDEEVRALDSVCNEKQLTYAEVTEFIRAVTDKMPVSDAAEILGVQMRKADNNE